MSLCTYLHIRQLMLILDHIWLRAAYTLPQGMIECMHYHAGGGVCADVLLWLTAAAVWGRDLE